MLIWILLFSVLLVIISLKKYGILTNPFVLEAYYTIMFLIIPQLVLINIGLGEEFALSNWVILAYLVSVFVGSSISIKTIKVSKISNERLCAVFSLVLAIILILPSISILLDCGLSFSGIRCYYETVVFSKFAGLYELGKTFLLFSVLLFLIYYRRIKWWLLILIVFIIFSGSKFAIFNFLIFIAIYLEVYKQVRIGKILVWSIPIALLMMLYHFSQSNNVESPFLAAISYFDIYEKQSFLLEKFETGKHDLYYGEISLSSYYKFIPRILWEGKPYNYGFAILNYDFLPEFAAANYMPSFGLGSLYADFGMLSIISGGFLAGFIRRYCYNVFINSHNNNTSFILYYFSISILTFQYLLVLVLISLFFKRAND